MGTLTVTALKRLNAYAYIYVFSLSRQFVHGIRQEGGRVGESSIKQNTDHEQDTWSQSMILQYTRVTARRLKPDFFF